jgi:peptidoglycan/LPS O-acetylase OafA/YrhL
MVIQAHPKYHADIDGIRAIAVLSVVGFHAFPKWITVGFIGVDIFLLSLVTLFPPSYLKI